MPSASSFFVIMRPPNPTHLTRLTDPTYPHPPDLSGRRHFRDADPLERRGVGRQWLRAGGEFVRLQQKGDDVCVRLRFETSGAVLGHRLSDEIEQILDRAAVPPSDELLAVQ